MIRTEVGGIISGCKYTIRNFASKQFLDVANSSSTNGAKVIQYTENQGKNQKFRMQYTKNKGAWQIFPSHCNGKVLDMGKGGKLIIFDNRKTDNQYWELVAGQSGQFFIRNVQSGKVLDVDSRNKNKKALQIQEWGKNGCDNQMFTLKVTN